MSDALITCSSCKRSRPEIPGLVEPKTCEPCRERRKVLYYQKHRQGEERTKATTPLDADMSESDTPKPQKQQFKKEKRGARCDPELDSDSDLPDLELLMDNIKPITKSKDKKTATTPNTLRKAGSGGNSKSNATLDDFAFTKTLLVPARGSSSHVVSPKRPRPRSPDLDEVIRSPPNNVERALSVTSSEGGHAVSEASEILRTAKRPKQPIHSSPYFPQLGRGKGGNDDRVCKTEDDPLPLHGTNQPHMHDPFGPVNAISAVTQLVDGDVASELEARKSDIMLRYLKDQMKGEPYAMTREVLMTLLLEVIDDSKREINDLKRRLTAVEKENRKLKRAGKNLE